MRIIQRTAKTIVNANLKTVNFASDGEIELTAVIFDEYRENPKNCFCFLGKDS